MHRRRLLTCLGTVASFIYNIIIAAFSSSIRKAIEVRVAPLGFLNCLHGGVKGQMQDMIRTAINESASSLLDDM